ncbi:MAG: endo-1,4-beta-xylanase, partial [Flavobacteriaceae bacterium]|nr:endo-1,4-beta-xylanase [Flavobacteriaceae bacterium]
MKLNNIFAGILVITILFSCKSNSEEEKTDENISEEKSVDNSDKGLKDYYSEYFPIGVAVAPNSFEGKDKELILEHFNSMTPENVMKMGVIHPEPNRFNWEPADKIADFAREHDMKLRGHALVWHQQAGPWIFQPESGNTKVSKDVLLERMKNHIDSVVTRYKGTIYAWDVVNEAISDNP